MKLEFIPVPVWSPPETGPWTLRENWPNGRQATTYPGCPSLLFDDRAEAQEWADLANRIGNRDGVVYDVVPATWRPAT
jgi:hypothetical protein